jgi:ATP-dependent helicase/nuclease subunit B
VSGELLFEASGARAWMRQWPRCTVVAPTRRAADAFVREAAIEGPVIGISRRSLRQWIVDGGPQVRLSALARRAELARVAARVDFEWFGEVAQTPGFVAALDRTIDELRRFEIPAERLEAEGPSGRDLAQVLRAYEADHAGVDDVDALRAASPPSGPHLFLDVAPADPMTARFLRAACEAGPWAALEAIDDPEAQAFWGELRTGARPRAESDAPMALPSAPALDFKSVADPRTEATELARWLLRETGGGAFDRKAVLLRHPGRQQAPIEAAFERAGVPAFFARGVRRPHPAGRAMLALLRCGEEGQSATRFAEYLSFGQVPEPDAGEVWGSPRVDWVPPGDDGQLVFSSADTPPTKTAEPDAAVQHGGLDTLRRWERWITDAGVVGGVERWRARLDGLLAEWTRNQATTEDGAEAENLERDLASLRRLRSFALPVVELLGDWAEPRSWKAWSERLQMLATRALRAPEPVQAIVAELAPVRARAEIAAVEVRALLTEALGELREEPSRDPYGAVFVGTPEDAAGRSFDAVVVPGMTEGRFPIQLRGDPLLPEHIRARLGAAFAKRPRIRREERRAFALCLASAPRVLLTYPRVADLDSENQVPSSFVLELWTERRGLDADPLRTEHGRRSYGPGWRVPDDPAEAVDEAEYDVAVAAGLDQATPGAARYLLAEGGNPHLARALRARYGRGQQRIGAHDGLWATTETLRTWLRERAPRKSIHSATSLESFAACPFKYWMHAVLRIRPRLDATRPDVLAPLTKGSIFHEILFELQQAQPETERMMAEVGPVVEAVAKKWFDELCPALPAVYWKSIRELEDDVRGWVRRAAERPVPRETAAAELAFGLPGTEGRDPASRTEPLELDSGHRLRGSVDRVERDAEGRLHVIDFKSGKVPDHPFGPLSGGRHLQPLIYAEAAERILGAPVDSATLLYATRRAGFFERPPVTLPGSARLSVLQDFFEQLDGQHEDARFIPKPEAGGCRWCDYRSLCGPVEEKRMGLKTDPDGAVFGRLERIRRMQ